MAVIERPKANSGDMELRDPEPSDLGWIVQAHAEFYSREFGWGLPFVAEVARIVSNFAAKAPHPKERCWIAVRQKQPVGSVMLVRDPDGSARLRVLLVLDGARGCGLGRRLTEVVIEEARRLGDSEIVLSTTNRQVEARQLYRSYGFELINSQPNTTFAPDENDETWRLLL